MTPKSLSIKFNERAQLWVMHVSYPDGARVYCFDRNLKRLLEGAANFVLMAAAVAALLVLPGCLPTDEPEGRTSYETAELERCCALAAAGLTTPVCTSVLTTDKKVFCSTIIVRSEFDE